RITAAHCAVDMALVPESVSRSMRMWGLDAEQIAAGVFQVLLAFRNRGVVQRLHTFDPERLDDGLHSLSVSAIGCSRRPPPAWRKKGKACREGQLSAVPRGVRS